MGNRDSRTNDLDSDEDGGSDYEHAYNYHTSAFRKSPADGFESDYDDDDHGPSPTGGRSLRALPSRNVKTGETNNSSPSSSAAVGAGDGRNRGGGRAEKTAEQNKNARNHSDSETNNHHQRQTGDAVQGLNSRARFCHQITASGVRLHQPRQVVVDNGSVPADTSTDVNQASGDSRHSVAPGQCVSTSTQESSSGGSGVRRDGGDNAGREGGGSDEGEESYETAGEGSGEEAESEGGSFSTITPPRTRPQSDSEYTVTEVTTGGSEEDSGEEEEEEVVDESEYDTERVASPISKSSLERMSRPRLPSRDPSPPVFRSSESSRSRLPRRVEMLEEAYRLARKRPPSPKQQSAAKRSRPSNEVALSSNRTRYGVFDTESESDTSRGRQVGRQRRAAPLTPPPPPPPPRPVAESRSLSTRTLRLVARKAASQFVETSRKILQDAKTAARNLRESTSKGKRRSSTVVEEEDGPSQGKKSSPEKGTHRRSPRISDPGPSRRIIMASAQSTESVSSRTRRGASKRKLQDSPSPRTRRKRQQRVETESESSSEIDDHTPLTRSATSRQVRKDGGRLRKFTRDRSPSATFFSPRSTARRSPRSFPAGVSSHISASLPVLPSASGDNVLLSSSLSRTEKQNRSFPSAASANPFHDVVLRPSPKTQSTGSVDSIGPEFAGMGNWPSPFAALLKGSGNADGPHTLTLSAGSVWARISSVHGDHTAASPPRGDHHQRSSQGSPAAGPSGARVATRTSAETPAQSYPTNSTPRVPSLTLTGQFAQSGRFAFLLENLLQVTIVANTITMATTSAVVVTTDGGLQHTGAAANSVLQAAGSELSAACWEFLKRQPRGLQVCEVLDTPAGGRLPPLISHVLHVVAPQTDSTSAGGMRQHRKLLLCTYLNCLKHTSEKLGLSSLGLPLIGEDSCSADECIQVFFDSLLVYLAERTPHCPLHALQLLIPNPALARFSAEVLEARLQALKTTSVDGAMAAVFKEYFNIPDFTRSHAIAGSAGGRSPSGKPAVKRRRL
ncbi:hypothetical protein ACOMHN_019862 [Nucella lapillus]